MAQTCDVVQLEQIVSDVFAPNTFIEKLEPLVLKAGYSQLRPGLPISDTNRTYSRSNADGSIDYLINTDLSRCYKSLEAFSGYVCNERDLTYIKFKDTQEVSEFEHLKKGLFDISESYGRTNRMGYKVSHKWYVKLVKPGLFLAGIIGSSLLYIAINQKAGYINSGTFIGGILSFVAVELGGAAYEGKKIRQFRDYLTQQYKTLLEQFNQQYVSKMSFGEEALKKALS
jgi:hypothetical protein